MTKLLTGTALALATLMTAPAFAAPQHHLSSAAMTSQARATNDTYVDPRDRGLVIDDGQVVGRDPDSFIRSQIFRDHGLPAN